MRTIIEIFLVGQSYTMGDEVKPCKEQRYVKNVRARSYSGPYFPPFGLNTEKYGLSLRIQSECQKIRTRLTPNTDTFYAVQVLRQELRSPI